MIKLYNLIVYVKALSSELKIAMAAAAIAFTAIASLVSQCNENNRLRSELESRTNVEAIKSDIKDIKDLTEAIKPPSLGDIKEDNREKHNNIRDSASDTF